jgi:hypothetical protein
MGDCLASPISEGFGETLQPQKEPLGNFFQSADPVGTDWAPSLIHFFSSHWSVEPKPI